jgi:hypothetical protein
MTKSLAKHNKAVLLDALNEFDNKQIKLNILKNLMYVTILSPKIVLPILMY